MVEVIITTITIIKKVLQLCYTKYESVWIHDRRGKNYNILASWSNYSQNDSSCELVYKTKGKGKKKTHEWLRYLNKGELIIDSKTQQATQLRILKALVTILPVPGDWKGEVTHSASTTMKMSILTLGNKLHT